MRQLLSWRTGATLAENISQPTAAEPPRVRASVATPEPVATADVGRLMATAPGNVARLLLLIILL